MKRRSLPTSFGSLCHLLERKAQASVLSVVGTLRFCHRRRGSVAAFALLLLLLIALIVYNPLSWRRIDHFLTFRVMARRFPKVDQELRDAGVVLPPTQIDHANVINTHAALRELLVRREKRARMLKHLELVAAQNCQWEGGDQNECSSEVARVLFVPNMIGWDPPLRPGPLAAHNYTVLSFDELEMRQVVEDVDFHLNPNESGQPLVEIFDRLSSLEGKTQLFSLCVVYLYGGIFVGNSRAGAHDDAAAERQQQWIRDLLTGHNQLFGGRFSHPVAALIVDESVRDRPDYQQIQLVAATPRHPLLGCLLMDLESKSPEFFVDKDSIMRHMAIGAGGHDELPWMRANMPMDVWLRLSHQGGLCSINACHNAILHETANGFPEASAASWGSDCSLYMRLIEARQRNIPRSNEMGMMSRQERSVSVTIEMDEVEPVRTKKTPLQLQLRENSAEPGWLCNRCLNWAAMGTFESCKHVCPVRYKEIICASPDAVEKVDLEVDVSIERFPSTRSKAIPRIIHQTWFEDITFDRYPQLARIQSSWKNTGWIYRFWTDDTARQYIGENYPTRFLEAFDALIHGAYKADLFRYLVLMKEGGIYADVDVMLEAPLDSFITPSMSFFAARDIPCEYAGEAYCLWNGFIGSSPGNPVLVRAVERLVNLIQERADIYDMEREACRQIGPAMDVWKVRAQPLLFMSGPCALGVALNRALNRSSLDSLPVGWVGMDDIEFGGGTQDAGDALVMVGDKYDLGEFRISDPERSFIVASTNINGLDKSPREWGNPIAGEIRRQSLRHSPLPHYSNSKRGVSLWGTANVYKDDLVANERIRLHVKVIDY